MKKQSAFFAVILIFVCAIVLTECNSKDNGNVGSDEPETTPAQSNEASASDEIAEKFNSDSREIVAITLYNRFDEIVGLLKESPTTGQNTNELLSSAEYTHFYSEYTSLCIQLYDLICGVDTFQKYLPDNNKNDYIAKRSQVIQSIKEHTSVGEEVMPIYSFYSKDTGDHLIILSANRYNFFSKSIMSFHDSYDAIRSTNDEAELFSALFMGEGNGGEFTNVADVFYENLYDENMSKDIVPVLVVEAYNQKEWEPENDYDKYMSDKLIFEEYGRDFYTGNDKMKSGNWRLFGFSVLADNAAIKINIDGKETMLINKLK